MIKPCHFRWKLEAMVNVGLAINWKWSATTFNSVKRECHCVDNTTIQMQPYNRSTLGYK